VRTYAAVGLLTAAVAATALAGFTGAAIALLALLAGGVGALVMRRLNGLAAATATVAGRVTGAEQGLAASETDRVTDTIRFKRLDARLGALRHQVQHDAINLHRAQLREVEGLHQLFGGFTPRAPMPSTGHWALNPTDLLALLHLVERRRPALVVELGSGTSTIWLAYALERLGGRIVSLDHEPAYAERTRTMLRAHRLESVAEVRDAPLRQISVRGDAFEWYDADALADLDAIDLLLVDGPPGSIGPLSRYPALSVLTPRLTPGATVVLDDLGRADEQETLRRWVAEDSLLTVEPTLIGQHAVLTYARHSTPAQRSA
jgi:predicted O-methyltransferase YrrM